MSTAMLSLNDIGKIINFEVYPAVILGTTFDRVEVLAFLDAQSAQQFIDPATLHANVYPTLPGGVPNRFDGYPYVKLRLSNGTITCLGLPWINNASISYEENVTYLIRVSNAGGTDYDRLRLALISNGYNDIIIEKVVN